MTHERAFIAGAGPIGLACGISAKRRGRDPLLVDAGAIANSIFHYPVGMTFFTTPERLEIGGHPIVSAGAKPTREEALKYYRGVARAEELRIRTFTRLRDAKRERDVIRCVLESRAGLEALTCDVLVLATGYFEQANRLDVPGEDLPHVHHYFDDAHVGAGLDVVVIGGKNSAVEAALQLYRAGARVTLVYRGSTLKPSVKYWLRPDFENRVKAGEISARFGAEVLRIEPEDVVIRNAGGGEERLRADRVYALIGFQPDFALFRKIGIELDDDGRPTINPATLETNVPGVYMAGSIVAGTKISEVFIENGRYDGEKIFGDPADRAEAQALYEASPRPVGE
ncbi:MAG TPA: YpdA family putative bacillithiol disulfide reductase [Gemmatimonadales bacterium]|jgi:thioredoxin reductase (NADPH)|nr:YpdA family putative bacillithiol disulfide reductase [Gemmatimonadales bacterium]